MFSIDWANIEVHNFNWENRRMIHLPHYPKRGRQKANEVARSVTDERSDWEAFSFRTVAGPNHPQHTWLRRSVPAWHYPGHLHRPGVTDVTVTSWIPSRLLVCSFHKRFPRKWFAEPKTMKQLLSPWLWRRVTVIVKYGTVCFVLGEQNKKN